MFNEGHAIIFLPGMNKYLIIFCLLFSGDAYAQKNRIDSLMHIKIDSVMVVSAKRGLSMNDFVRVMINDTAFYEAFRNLKRFSFIAENNINTYTPKDKPQAKIYRKIYHNNTGSIYKQEVLESRDSGKVYKRSGDYNLYTVRMFSYIFMNEGNSDYIESGITSKQKDEEGYKQKLKTLIFNPGAPVEGVPLISSKTKIFEEPLKEHYDFNFYHARYQDTIPVYYFTGKIKAGTKKSVIDDLMIKELTTVFDGRNFNILGRYIDMSYTSIPFDFDVKMRIELSYIDENTLVPTKIFYNGNWDIPFKSPEICTFDIKHYNFK